MATKYKVKRMFFHYLKQYQPGDEIELEEREVPMLKYQGYIGDKVKQPRRVRRAKPAE